MLSKTSMKTIVRRRLTANGVESLAVFPPPSQSIDDFSPPCATGGKNTENRLFLGANGDLNDDRTITLDDRRGGYDAGLQSRKDHPTNRGPRREDRLDRPGDRRDDEQSEARPARLGRRLAAVDRGPDSGRRSGRTATVHTSTHRGVNVKAPRTLFSFIRNILCKNEL